MTLRSKESGKAAGTTDATLQGFVVPIDATDCDGLASDTLNVGGVAYMEFITAVNEYAPPVSIFRVSACRPCRPTNMAIDI